jgi:hypothetical protein
MVSPINVKLSRNEKKVLEHITEICRTSPDKSCFKSIKNIAPDCGMALQTAHKAKHKLKEFGLITLREIPNGKRLNRRHKIELVLPKVEPRTNLQYEWREYRERVKWEEFDKYSAGYVNNLSKLDQIDLYVELGLRVIPLHFLDEGKCTCRQLDCKTPAKHPIIRWKNNGKKTEEMKTSSNFWRKNSFNQKHNVGILLPDDIVIIDADKRRGGDIALKYLQEELGELSATLSAKSGGGGSHDWYLLPPEMKITSGSNVLANGIDILTAGNLVVASSSVHRSGNAYSWLRFGKPAELPADYEFSLL